MLIAIDSIECLGSHPVKSEKFLSEDYIKYPKGQLSGIDTIKYHTGPRIPMGKQHSQLDITNESQEVSPYTAGDYEASINRHAQKHNQHTTEIT